MNRKKPEDLSMSKKAIQMRNLRLSRALDTRYDISPDMTDKLYDIEYEKTKSGRKKRNGKIISKTLNREKANDLVFSLLYQFKIYTNTTLIYWLTNGKKQEITKRKKNVLVYHIYNGLIDMTKGIYAKQSYRKTIFGKDIEFSNKSNAGLYSSLQFYLHKKPEYAAKITLKDGTVKIMNGAQLKKEKYNIDYTERQYIVSLKPRYWDRTNFNSELGAYWMKLGKLSNREQVERYEMNKVKNSLKNDFMMIDGVEKRANINAVKSLFELEHENDDNTSLIVEKAKDLYKKVPACIKDNFPLCGLRVWEDEVYLQFDKYEENDKFYIENNKENSFIFCTDYSRCRVGICDTDTLEQVLSKRDVKVYTEDKAEAGCKTNLKSKTIDELLEDYKPKKAKGDYFESIYNLPNDAIKFISKFEGLDIEKIINREESFKAVLSFIKRYAFWFKKLNREELLSFIDYIYQKCRIATSSLREILLNSIENTLEKLKHSICSNSLIPGINIATY